METTLGSQPITRLKVGGLGLLECRLGISQGDVLFLTISTLTITLTHTLAVTVAATAPCHSDGSKSLYRLQVPTC